MLGGLLSRPFKPRVFHGGETQGGAIPFAKEGEKAAPPAEPSFEFPEDAAPKKK